MINYPINIKSIGKGKNVVLFLHGYGGSIQSFLPVAEKLQNDTRIILVDLYGFGDSKFPDFALDTYDYANQLYLKIKELNISHLSIVAHSFGGRIALILASMFDLDVDKLVLVSSAGLKPRRGLLYYYKIWKYKILKKLVKIKLLKPTYLNKFGSSEYKQLDKIQKISYVKIVNQDLLYLLKYIKTQTLIVWGTKDKSTPLYMAKCLHKNLVNSGVFFYKNGSHFCYLENFVHFCAILRSFLCN